MVIVIQSPELNLRLLGPFEEDGSFLHVINSPCMLQQSFPVLAGHRGDFGSDLTPCAENVFGLCFEVPGHQVTIAIFEGKPRWVELCFELGHLDKSQRT